MRQLRNIPHAEWLDTAVVKARPMSHPYAAARSIFTVTETLAAHLNLDGVGRYQDVIHIFYSWDYLEMVLPWGLQVGA